MKCYFAAAGCLLLFLTLPSHAFCFRDAGARYRIDPQLLQAIATQESGMNPRAVNHNRDKHGRITSTDYGLMQINSTHVPELIRLGIIHSREELLTNACLNVEVGAWILARAFQVCNVNWQCLGAYNAGFSEGNPHRLEYARRIYAIYRRLKGLP